MTYQLLQGDCLDILPTLEAQSVHAIIGDLPYGTTACAWDEVIPFHDFLEINGKRYEKKEAFEFLDRLGFSEQEIIQKWEQERTSGMWTVVRHVLKQRGAFITTASQPFTSKLIMSNLEWFKYCLIWRKSHAANFLNAKYMPLIKHEDILIFSGGTTTYNPQIVKGPRKLNRSGKEINQRENSSIYGSKPSILANVESFEYQPISILEFSAGARMDMIHPTQKPVALYEYLIKTYTNPGDTVMDFTMGSGTTGVACIHTGRNFIGIEKDAAYFEIAKRRIEQAQPPLFVEQPAKQQESVTQNALI